MLNCKLYKVTEMSFKECIPDRINIISNSNFSKSCLDNDVVFFLVKLSGFIWYGPVKDLIKCKKSKFFFTKTGLFVRFLLSFTYINIYIYIVYLNDGVLSLK